MEKDEEIDANEWSESKMEMNLKKKRERKKIHILMLYFNVCV